MHQNPLLLGKKYLGSMLRNFDSLDYFLIIGGLGDFVGFL
jgi:hypothetical protein